MIPERIYGYFAAEKPVVCLYPRRYIPKYDDVIYSATTTDEFELACRKAINEAGRRRSQRRGEYARRADWSVRIELLEQYPAGKRTYVKSLYNSINEFH